MARRLHRGIAKRWRIYLDLDTVPSLAKAQQGAIVTTSGTKGTKEPASSMALATRGSNLE